MFTALAVSLRLYREQKAYRIDPTMRTDDSRIEQLIMSVGYGWKRHQFARRLAHSRRTLVFCVNIVIPVCIINLQADCRLRAHWSMRRVISSTSVHFHVRQPNTIASVHFHEWDCRWLMMTQVGLRSVLVAYILPVYSVSWFLPVSPRLLDYVKISILVRVTVMHIGDAESAVYCRCRCWSVRQ